MSHVSGFHSVAFPAWWKLSLWGFSSPHLPKEPNPEVWGWRYQFLHHPAHGTPGPAVSPTPPPRFHTRSASARPEPHASGRKRVTRSISAAC